MEFKYRLTIEVEFFAHPDDRDKVTDEITKAVFSNIEVYRVATSGLASIITKGDSDSGQ